MHTVPSGTGTLSFHTGGAATREQVLEFYARNGDVPAGGNLGPGIGNIGPNQQERPKIVEFLKALTDDRVLPARRRGGPDRTRALD
jgi:hypothetical protein